MVVGRWARETGWMGWFNEQVLSMGTSDLALCCLHGKDVVWLDGLEYKFVIGSI